MRKLTAFYLSLLLLFTTVLTPCTVDAVEPNQEMGTQTSSELNPRSELPISVSGTESETEEDQNAENPKNSESVENSELVDAPDAASDEVKDAAEGAAEDADSLVYGNTVDEEFIEEENFGTCTDPVFTETSPGIDVDLVRSQEDPELLMMVSDEENAWINQRIEQIMNQEVVSEDTTLSMASSMESFLTSKNQGLLAAGGLTMEADPYNEDLVQVLEAGVNGMDQYVFVVEDNAYCVCVRDDKGEWLSDAYVTISYLDENNNRVTKSAATSSGHISGYCVFSNMEGIHEGYIDVQKEGYRSVTILDETMEGGDQKVIVLQKAEENDVYVRGVDLSGLDLVNKPVSLTLLPDSETKLKFSILMSKTGDAELPESVKLVNTVDHRVIREFTSPEVSDFDSTCIFSLEDLWVKQNGDLLKQYDSLGLEYGDTTYKLTSVTVTNAMVRPSFEPETDLPINQKAKGELPGALTPLGKGNLGLNIGNIKVSLGIFPDGHFVIMGSGDLKGAREGFERLFPKTENPKVAEQVDGLFAKIRDGVKKNIAKCKTGAATLKSRDTIVPFVDSNGSTCIANIAICLTGSYDKEEQAYAADLLFAWNMDVNGGHCFYTYIIIGPISFPFYFGYQVALKSTSSVDFGVLLDSVLPVPSGIRIDKKNTANIESVASPSFAAYVGAGIRGVLGGDIEGKATFDIGAYFRPLDVYQSRLFIDLAANINANYYYLAGSGSVNLWKPKDKTRIFDSKDYVKPPLEAVSSELNWQPLNLSSMEEPVINEVPGLHLTPILQAGNESVSEDNSLTTYTIASAPLLTASKDSQRISRIVSNSYVDNQIQLVTTHHYVALFRTIARDGKVRLVYQLQKDDGSFDPTLHEVAIPDDASVFEYHAWGTVSNYSRTEYNNLVHIGAIVGDASNSDADERQASSKVVALTVDLASNSEPYAQIVSPKEESGSCYYFNPIPAENGGKTIVAYSKADSYKSKDSYVNILANADGGWTEMSRNTPMYSSHAAFTDNSRAYWTIDSDGTSENNLRIKAWTKHGTQPSEFAIADLDTSNFANRDPKCMINGWTALGQDNFVVADGKVYYLDRDLDGSRQQHFVEMTYPDGKAPELGGSQANYIFFTDVNDDGSVGAIYIASAVAMYGTDADGLISERTGTELRVSSIRKTFSSYYGTQFSLHGSQNCYLEDSDMSVFAAALSKQGQGMTVVYDQKNESTEGTDLYQWLENAQDGLALTGFEVESPVVSTTQKYMAATVTYKNVGYSTQGPVRFELTDSKGTVLTQARWNNPDQCYYDMGADEGYNHMVLYPGDSYRFTMYFKPNPDWKVATEEKLTLRIVGGAGEFQTKSGLKAVTSAPALRDYSYDFLADAKENPSLTANTDGSLTLTFAKPYVTMSGQKISAGEQHFVNIQLANESSMELSEPTFNFTAVNRDGTETLLRQMSMRAIDVNERNLKNASYHQVMYHFLFDLDDLYRKLDPAECEGIMITLDTSGDDMICQDQVFLELSAHTKAEGEENPDEADQPNNPDKPGNTDQPNNPDKPGNTDQPSNPEKPGNSTNQGASSVSGNQNNSGSDSRPVISNKPVISGGNNASGNHSDGNNSSKADQDDRNKEDSKKSLFWNLLHGKKEDDQKSEAEGEQKNDDQVKEQASSNTETISASSEDQTDYSEVNSRKMDHRVILFAVGLGVSFLLLILLLLYLLRRRFKN